MGFKVDGILTEDVVPSPVGPDGESKIAAENYIQEHMPADKQVYIFRPCMIHGPGNKGNLNLLYNVVKKGIPWSQGRFREPQNVYECGEYLLCREWGADQGCAIGHLQYG